MSLTKSNDNFLNESMSCNVCYRQIKRERLTLKFLFNDMLKNMFNLERGLLFTILELFKNPEVVINDFVQGERYRYMNPFRFLIVSASLYALVVSVFGFSIEGMIEMQEENPLNLSVLKEYSNLMILAYVPIVAIGSWLAFRPAKLNYAEHLVVNAYAYSFMTIISIPLDIFFSAFLPGFDAYWEMVSSPLLLLVIFYVYVRTLSTSIIKGILRTLLTYLYVILISIIVFTPIGVLFKILNG
jgi:hypothetical protein